MKILKRSLDFNVLIKFKLKGSNVLILNQIVFQILLFLNILTFINSNYITSDKPKPKPNIQKSKFLNWGINN